MEENNVENKVEDVVKENEQGTKKVKVQIKLKDMITMGVLAVLVIGIVVFGLVTLFK